MFNVNSLNAFHFVLLLQGVDVVASASLVYPKGRTASLSTTIRADLPSEAFVVGTKGTIKVRNILPFW